MLKRHVLVLCGSNAATSNALQQALEKACTENGIDAEVETCGMFDLQQWAGRADLVVSTGVEPRLKNKPVVRARSLLNGGLSQTLDEILGLLRAMG